jgi:hypothetical protein
MSTDPHKHRRALLTANRSNHIADSIAPVFSRKTLPLKVTLPHIKKALILLHKNHEELRSTFDPTQTILLAAYHKLLISLYAYIKSKVSPVNGRTYNSGADTHTVSHSTNTSSTVSGINCQTGRSLTETENDHFRSLQWTHLSHEISSSGLQSHRIRYSLAIRANHFCGTQAQPHRPVWISF